MPLITIITPTFNRREYLKKARESVVNQTFKDWEWIIVDDGSTDGTEEDYKNESDNRIRFIRLEQNSGGYLGVPRNIAMKEVKGTLISFLDSDCEFTKDHLQVLYKEMERTIGFDGLHEVDGVYGDRLLVDDTGEHPTVPGISGDWSVKRLLYQNYIDTSDVLITKESLESVGGWDESIEKFADWNLWVRLGKAGYSLRHVPIIITNYHVHEGMNQLKTKKTIVDLFDPMHCRLWSEKTVYGEAPKLKVAVYTLCKDRKDYTEECFKSMREKTKYPFTHFVVNQGSTEYDDEWLKSLGVDTVIHNEENVGISKGSNQAVEKILKYEYENPYLVDELRKLNFDIIIKVDNDAIFLTDNWLEAIVDVNERVRGYVVSPYVEGLIDHPGGVPRRRMDNPKMSPYGYVGRNLVGFAPHLGGICVAAPRSVYEKFRWKDKDFFHGIQDFEFSQFCLKLGLALAYLENVKIEHKDTETGQREKYPEYYKEKDEILKVSRYEK